MRSKTVINFSFVVIIGAAAVMIYETKFSDFGRLDIQLQRSDEIKPDKTPAVNTVRLAENQNNAEIKEMKRARKDLRKKAKPSGKAKARAVPPELDHDRLSPADKKLYDDLQTALDEEDLGSLRMMLQSALKSGSVIVRQQAVDALAWFDEKALFDLALFIADPDDDVSDSALLAVEMSLRSIEEESDQAASIEQLIANVGLTAKTATMVADVLNGFTEELISADVVVRLLSSVSDSEVRKVLADGYEFITTEPYTSRGDYEKWRQSKIAENAEDAGKDD